MFHSISRRLEKLENKEINKYSEILTSIRQGRFYDDLTEEQKDLYCLYHGQTREALEEVTKAVYQYETGVKSPDLIKKSALHFKLEYSKKPPTSEELKKIIEEVEESVTTK